MFETTKEIRSQKKKSEGDPEAAAPPTAFSDADELEITLDDIVSETDLEPEPESPMEPDELFTLLAKTPIEYEVTFPERRRPKRKKIAIAAAAIAGAVITSAAIALILNEDSEKQTSKTDDTSRSASAAALLPATPSPAIQLPEQSITTASAAPSLQSGLQPTQDESDADFVDKDGGWDWGDRCVLHMRATKYPQALWACEKGLSIATGKKVRAALLFNTGRIYEYKDENDKAVEYYQMSLDVRPDNKTVRRRLKKLIGQTQGPAPTTIFNKSPNRNGVP